MKLRRLFLNTITLAILSGAAHPGFAEVVKGQASYYADSLQGNATASGETYDKKALTAAHRTLAFGTRVRVKYLKTGKTVEVTINDRGPYVNNRIIDLSGAAAASLGLEEDGIGEVEIEVLK